MDFTEAKARAARALEDIGAAPNNTGDCDWERHQLPASEFPLPELVLVGLRDLRDLESWGPGEKLRWGVSAAFKDVPFSVSLEKFGLRLYVPRGLDSDLRSEILRSLKTAAKLSEAWLRDVAGLQIEKGNVTIQNQYHYFEGAYQFFRKKAGVAYDAPPPDVEVIQVDNDGRPTGWSSQPWLPQIEGGYLAGAMVDAYFSRLEHLLVLVLPFLDFDPSAGTLVRFVGMTWDEKWRQVFDVTTESAAKVAYDQLKEIKETVRNPLSHGGFAKKGMSFFFQVEKVGALPALLTNHGQSFEVLFTRVPEPTYQELCAQLDEIDAFMTSSAVGAGIQYAVAGLNVAFSDEFRESCKAAAQSPQAIQEFIEHQAYLADVHANMDY